MDVQILASILGGLVGGLFTFLGVLITIAYERSKERLSGRKERNQQDQARQPYGHRHDCGKSFKKARNVG